MSERSPLRQATDIASITLNDGGRPKGFVPYRPTKATRVRHDRILELFNEYRGDPQVGPRSVGYRLKERYVGQYVKDLKKFPARKQLKAAGVQDFQTINNSITRMVQGCIIPMSWVSDAAAVTYEDQVWRDRVGFLRDVPEFYARDRTEGQPVVIEVYNEAREDAGLIRQICSERGVTSYSGGGKCGPHLAHQVASRALIRAVEHGQSTLILGLGDFVRAGIHEIMRPHIENVSAFLYGTDRRNHGVLTYDNEGGIMAETDVSTSFRHLALTPEMALDLLGLAEAEQHRARIEDYIASGPDLFTRDIDLLDGVQKIELEAVDPVDLKALVTEAIEDVLDLDELRRIENEEDDERADLERRLGELADDLGGGSE